MLITWTFAFDFSTIFPLAFLIVTGSETWLNTVWTPKMTVTFFHITFPLSMLWCRAKLFSLTVSSWCRTCWIDIIAPPFSICMITFDLDFITTGCYRWLSTVLFLITVKITDPLSVLVEETVPETMFDWWFCRILTLAFWIDGWALGSLSSFPCWTLTFDTAVDSRGIFTFQSALFWRITFTSPISTLIKSISWVSTTEIRSERWYPLGILLVPFSVSLADFRRIFFTWNAWKKIFLALIFMPSLFSTFWDFF